MALWMLWIFVLPAAFSSDSYLEPKYPTSQLGDSLVLKCSTRRCEKPRFRWMALDDQPLMHKSETNPSPTESQLVFHRVTLAHKTKIECAAFCDDKRVFFSTARVNVYSFRADPEVSGHDRLRHGEKSSLTCVVRDVYPADLLKVEWVQGETVLSTTVENNISADDAVETHTSVYSYIPEFGDGKKNITCRATLELEGVQTRQTTVNLTVQTPPQNTTVTVSPSWQVQEGQDVTISCRTVSSPPPRYVLKKDGSDVEMESQDGTFRLQKVQLRDAGLYQLTVSNQLGSSTERLTLNVTGPPQNTTVTVSPSWQVQEGQDVTISCQTVCSPPPRYVLKKDGSDVEIESQDGTFRLQQVQLRDAGLYQLTVSNQLGSSTERLTLNVTAPPRNTTVTVSPSWQVQEGQDVTISCQTISSPRPRYFLKKDGSDVEMESQDGTFRLRQVQLRDAGRYQLTVSNRLGSSTERLTLNVTGSPRNTTVTVSPSWQVQKGQDVTISCRTVSSPPPRYVLRKDGSDVEMESQDGTFRLQQVQLRDAGLYQLTVSNRLGFSTERLTLNVTGPPRNTTVTVSPSWQVQEGQDVTISGQTISSPPPRYFLKKDGSDVEMESHDGTFRLRQVQLRDAGLYQLTVSNRLGSSTERLTLNVTGPPRNTTVTVSPSWQVQEGQDVTISCRTVSSPPPRYVLKKDGSDIEMESQDGTFRLRQVQLHDAGLYQLTVSNQLGSSTERLTLSVTTGPPRNTMVKVSLSWQVQEGQDVTISCQTVSSPPPRYVLRKDGSDVEMESQDGTFRLWQVQLRDAGLYQLTVSNQLGSSTERLTLSVTAPPRNTTVTVSLSWQVQEGQDVTITYRTVSSPNLSFPSLPLPVQDPPPKDHIILLAVIGSTVVTMAALVTYHLRKAKTRGVYELLAV